MGEREKNVLARGQKLSSLKTKGREREKKARVTLLSPGKRNIKKKYIYLCE